MEEMENGRRGTVQGAGTLSAPWLEGAAGRSWVPRVVRDTGDVCATGGPEEAHGTLHQALGAPGLPLKPADQLWALPGATWGGGHLTVLPVGQLQGLDVLQRDAVLQQEAAQVRGRELREDVGDIWWGRNRVVSRPTEGPHAGAGLGGRVPGTLLGHAGDRLTTLGGTLAPGQSHSF